MRRVQPSNINCLKKNSLERPKSAYAGANGTPVALTTVSRQLSIVFQLLHPSHFAPRLLFAVSQVSTDRYLKCARGRRKNASGSRGNASGQRTGKEFALGHYLDFAGRVARRVRAVSFRGLAVLALPG